jgi:hypothetical protein
MKERQPLVDGSFLEQPRCGWPKRRVVGRQWCD